MRHLVEFTYLAAGVGRLVVPAARGWVSLRWLCCDYGLGEALSARSLGLGWVSRGREVFVWWYPAVVEDQSSGLLSLSVGCSSPGFRAGSVCFALPEVCVEVPAELSLSWAPGLPTEGFGGVRACFDVGE